MMSTGASQGGTQINCSLLVGGEVLVGIGGLLGFMGIVLVGSALLSATRHERPARPSCSLITPRMMRDHLPVPLAGFVAVDG